MIAVPSVRGVLFDLDGTLADTAPDLVAVLNRLLHELGRAPMPYAIARNEVSNGALGLLRLGLGLNPDDEVDAALRQRFLDVYEADICAATTYFLDPDRIARICEPWGALWGIVTNKPMRLTQALLDRLPPGQPACVVAGDTLARRKPHPDPLLHAAGLIGISPAQCVYVGDSRRDITAGIAAGMRTMAVGYGYIRLNDRIDDWGASTTARTPVDVYRRVSEMLEAGGSA